MTRLPCRSWRDHAFSFESAARIITYGDGKQVVTWHRGRTQAYSIHHERDWLTYVWTPP